MSRTAFYYVQLQSLADGTILYLRHNGPERTLVTEKAGANRFAIKAATKLVISLHESKQYSDYNIDIEPCGYRPIVIPYTP